MENNEQDIKVEVIDVDKKTWKEKAKDVWEKAKKMSKRGLEWVDTHKDTAIILGSLAIGTINAVHKASVTRRTEEKRYEYYDPHTGAHWALRRRLTNDERAELMRRQRSGEYTEYILEDMGVLR